MREALVLRYEVTVHHGLGVCTFEVEARGPAEARKIGYAKARESITNVRVMGVRKVGGTVRAN